MLLFARGSATDELSAADLRAGLFAALDRLGPRRRVLAVPPDFTRLHSRAGELTRCAWEYYGPALRDVLPALGTHTPMTAGEIERMYGGVPAGLFREHDWRGGTVTLGEVPAAFVREASEGAVDYAWPVQVARCLAEGGHDLILSIGQVVPHEVLGMANHAKNIFVGTGGPEAINKSHFLGAAYGMERMMGRLDTPVRAVLDYAAERFARHLPIVYALTVVGRGAEGALKVRGLYIGSDRECLERAAALAREVNVERVARPLRKVVAWLDPLEYKSTWLGNKSIYRTRMAIADGGELVVLAPGVREFGEDPEIDRLIRRYGYAGRERVLELVRREPELAANLSAAAHLIHGSVDGRFTVTYCAGRLSRAEIEGVHFQHNDIAAALERYRIEKLAPGFNTLEDGEEIFYVPNPALGLWACGERLG